MQCRVQLDWLHSVRRKRKRKGLVSVLVFYRPPDSIENLTVTSPSTIAPVSTSLLSFDGTVTSNFNGTRPFSAGSDHKLSRRSQSCDDVCEKTSRSPCRQEKRSQESPLMIKGASTPGSQLSPSSHVVKSVFVQGVGWASQASLEAAIFFFIHFINLYIVISNNC